MKNNHNLITNHLHFRNEQHINIYYIYIYITFSTINLKPFDPLSKPPNWMHDYLIVLGLEHI